MAIIHGINLSVDVMANPDFALAGNPAQQGIRRGESADYVISVTPLDGFDVPVLLSVEGLPADILPSFSVNPVTFADGWQSILTLAVDAGVGVANYAFTVTGTSEDGESVPLAVATSEMIT